MQKLGARHVSFVICGPPTEQQRTSRFLVRSSALDCQTSQRALDGLKADLQAKREQLVATGSELKAKKEQLRSHLTCVHGGRRAVEQAG